MKSKKLTAVSAATVLAAGALLGGVARGDSDIVNLISTATIDNAHKVSSTQPIQCDGTFPIIILHDDGTIDSWIRDNTLHVWLAKYHSDKTSQADINAEYKFVRRVCH